MVYFGACVAEVWKSPSNGIVSMAVNTISPVEKFPLVHNLARSVHVYGRLGRAAVSKWRDFQFRCSANSKRENPAEPWLCGSPVRRINEAGLSTPSSHHSDVLCAIQHVGDGRGHNSCSSVILPEFLAVGGAIGQQNSVGPALENEIPG